MIDIGVHISYSIAFFLIVLVSGCILNLLKQHFIFQLAGIAFLFTFAIFKSIGLLNANDNITIKELYIFSLPMLMGVSACLISMVLGFWVFPYIRKRFRK